MQSNCPILRGRDIKRYSYEFADLWLITTHNGSKEKGIPPVKIDDYPAIKKHLDSFSIELEKRSDKGDTPYNLRNCAYMEDFYKPKIVWGEISDYTKFAVDLDGSFISEATTFLLVGESIVYLVGFLNSKLSEYIFSKIGTTTGVGTVRWKKYTVEKLRIPKAIFYEQTSYEKLIKQIISHPIDSLDAIKLANELDNMIYKEYGLSPDEVEFLQNY